MTLNDLFHLLANACYHAGACFGFLVSAVLVLIGISTWYMLMGLAVLLFLLALYGAAKLQTALRIAKQAVADAEQELEDETPA